MTDLPRFHKGGLGPLDFQTINEAFRRLDALRPLIESAGLSQAGNIASERVTVVTASRIPPQDLPDGVLKDPPLYQWREVLVRGGGEEENANTLVEDDDPDFEAITARTTFRSGPLAVDDKEPESAPGTGYGVCVDPNFQSGICVLVSYRRTDSDRVQLLCPVSSPTSTFLAQIVSPPEAGTIDLVGNCDGGASEGSAVKIWYHTARRLHLVGAEDSTAPNLCRGAPFNVVDFSRQNSNAPSADGVTFEEYGLVDGNVIVVHMLTFGGGTPFYYCGWLPRLDFTCEDEDPGIFRGGGGSSRPVSEGGSY